MGLEPRYRASDLGRLHVPAISAIEGRFQRYDELGNERDPIIGNQDGTLEFKIPKRPIRKKISGLPAFTTVRGGAYFFLPGIKALRYLATLDDVG